MVENPVEGGGRQDGVNLLRQVEAQQVGHVQADPWAGPKPLGGLGDHGRRAVNPDHPAAWQAGQQLLGHPSRPAAGVQNGFVAAQVQALQDVSTPAGHGVGQPFILVCVPLSCHATPLKTESIVPCASGLVHAVSRPCAIRARMAGHK